MNRTNKNRVLKSAATSLRCIHDTLRVIQEECDEFLTSQMSALLIVAEQLDERAYDPEPDHEPHLTQEERQLILFLRKEKSPAEIFLDGFSAHACSQLEDRDFAEFSGNSWKLTSIGRAAAIELARREEPVLPRASAGEIGDRVYVLARLFQSDGSEIEELTQDIALSRQLFERTLENLVQEGYVGGRLIHYAERVIPAESYYLTAAGRIVVKDLQNNS